MKSETISPIITLRSLVAAKNSEMRQTRQWNSRVVAYGEPSPECEKRNRFVAGQLEKK